MAEWLNMDLSYKKGTLTEKAEFLYALFGKKSSSTFYPPYSPMGTETG